MKKDNVWKIAFCNLKGGVGKTTLSVQFARFLALHKKKVLLVDADSQGNASSLLIPESTGEEDKSFATLGIKCTTAYELFSEECGEIVPFKTASDVDIIPSEVADANLVRCSFKSMEASLHVAKNIRKIEDEYDFIIFDCPPSLGTALAGPLMASDRLIVPVVLGGNFQETLLSIRAAIEAIRATAKDLRLLGYVVNNLPRKSPFDEKLFEAFKDKMQGSVFSTCIHNRLTTMRASQFKESIFEMPNKQARLEMTKFFDEILTKLGQEPLGVPPKKEGKEEK